jgi:hypothetical protein
VAPLVRAGVLAAFCSAFAVLAARPVEKRRVGTPALPAQAQAQPGPVAPCPRGTLPDANVCIPVPKPPPAAAASTGGREPAR